MILNSKNLVLTDLLKLSKLFFAHFVPYHLSHMISHWNPLAQTLGPPVWVFLANCKYAKFYCYPFCINPTLAFALHSPWGTDTDQLLLGKRDCMWLAKFLQICGESENRKPALTYWAVWIITNLPGLVPLHTLNTGVKWKQSGLVLETIIWPCNTAF